MQYKREENVAGETLSEVENPNAKTPENTEPIGDMRRGERRQNTQRRDGLRGLWEERRLFDRRAREYSMFGKRFDGSDDEEIDISKVPDVEDELLLSPTEIEIFEEQDEAERTKDHHRRHDDEPVKRRRAL